MKLANYWVTVRVLSSVLAGMSLWLLQFTAPGPGNMNNTNISKRYIYFNSESQF